jgi:hypothetical protein
VTRLCVCDKARLGRYRPYETLTQLHIKAAIGKLIAPQLEALYHQKLDAALSARSARCTFT